MPRPTAGARQLPGPAWAVYRTAMNLTKSMFSMMIALGLLMPVAAIGCKGKGSDGGSQSDVKWPAQPADGTPLIAEFQALAGSGDRIEAKFRLYNFADKDVRGISMTLHYLDASGKELKDFPWSQSKGSGLVGKKGTADIKGGAFIPAETKSVTAELRSVDYADGTKWEIAN